MGREVKRVALDFEWSLNRVWEGFIMPSELRPQECPDCQNGYSAFAHDIYQKWWGYAKFSPSETGSTPFLPDDPKVMDIIRRKINRDDATIRSYDELFGSRGENTYRREAARMCAIWNGQLMHHLSEADVGFLMDKGQIRLRYDKKQPLTARDANYWSLEGMGYSSSECHSIIERRCDEAGVSMTCSTCQGTHDIFANDAARAAYEDWEETEPPEGDGWQMWENTSEGSPISPVFGTPEELARWLADTKASSFGDNTATYDQWLKTIMAGYAPSAIMVNGKMVSGVEAV